MKSYIILSHKGGVGKTTLTGSCASAISAKGHNVLMVDCDEQSSLTQWVLSKPNDHDANLITALNEPHNSQSIIVDAIHPITEHLHLLPSPSYESLNVDLFRHFLAKSNNIIIYALELFLKTILSSQYDYVFFDVAPRFGVFEKTLLANIDEVLYLMTPDYLVLKSFPLLTTLVSETNVVRSNNNKHPLAADNIIINLINLSYRSHNDCIKQLNTYSKNGGTTYTYHYIKQARSLVNLQETNDIVGCGHNYNIRELAHTLV